MYKIWAHIYVPIQKNHRHAKFILIEKMKKSPSAGQLRLMVKKQANFWISKLKENSSKPAKSNIQNSLRYWIPCLSSFFCTIGLLQTSLPWRNLRANLVGRYCVSPNHSLYNLKKHWSIFNHHNPVQCWKQVF